MSATESFRGFLSALDAAGELNRIQQPVSWDLEAAAITTRANERDAAIPVFETMSGDAASARLVGDPYRGPPTRPWANVARGAGIDPRSDSTTFFEAMVERLESRIEPKTVERDEAPCKAVVNRGSDADLLDLPWPYIHQGDGGRYSSLHTLVAPDPTTEWGRCGDHRAMIHGTQRASVRLLAGEQIPNRYYYDYERGGEPMPVAIAIGPPPAVSFTSNLWIPTGRSEFEFAGSIRGSAIELVECETNDLYVPATAEIVIEGHIHPDDRLDEGPYGDYLGFMHGPRRSMPALDVAAITHRPDPYLPFCVDGSGTGYPFNSSNAIEHACSGPDATIGARAAGFDIERSATWPYTEQTVFVFATEEQYDGYFHDVANFVFTSWGMLRVDFFIFVDADVDPMDPRAVFEAIALHADPEEDFYQFGIERMPKTPLNIYQTPEEKGSADLGTSKTKTAKAYIDATRAENAEGVEQTVYSDRRLRERAQETLATAGFDASKLPLSSGRGKR
ncbi:probable prenyl carboxy-lyase [Natronomonas pharaonis DSM 2160]|uniref:Probable prenyl carboxy-lyase n=1 Tax=Natronomonas pharaonis (strain ATCC 35678 / DSM 2160 / CIP 103997 / JCM 8858 / NBRC 14720 / NCIMB 2260 / Gabara) TaxID=348780 RepID=A0A1U7EXB9_NATPD|nr:UbiD family decarboxylase [Natronomonas pharaonis]CAI49798.1 probable prenyl carboxy-lyase [Natronomonas pharaonis DSM 2160]